MKNTLAKVSVLLMSLLVLHVMPAMAQQSQSHSPKHQIPSSPQAQQSQRYYETCKRLGLSPEQEKKMGQIMKESRHEMKTLKEANKDKPKEEKQKLVMEQFKKTDDKVNAILNKNQQVVWKEIVEERKAEYQRKKAEQMKHKEVSETDDTQGLL